MATPEALTLKPLAGFRCRICDGVGPFQTYRVREMMFALGERFDYALCAACGCLQIVEIPTDLSRYYGAGYYSFGPRATPGRVGEALSRARNRHLVGRTDPLGWVLAKLRPFRALASLKPLQLAHDARIVDVGCGSGELLLALRSAGFTRLLGIDPFIERELDLGGGLRVLRAELGSLPNSSFDLVMFHHSLEHIGDEHAALQAAHGLLVPGGRCMVRIPTVSSYAWRHYGVDWCALDAPRHLVLHSTHSIRLLADRCGFRVTSISDDSTSFQFWGSEQYRRDIPLMRRGCNDIVPAPGAFLPSQLRDYVRLADQLNRQRDGDQIVVELQRIG
jgi:SAM-dependent methyltransferase